MNKTARAFISCLKPQETYIVKVEQFKKAIVEHPIYKGSTYEKTIREEIYNGVIWTGAQMYAFDRGMRNYYEKRYTRQHGRPSAIPVYLDYVNHGYCIGGREYITYNNDYVITIKHNNK